MIFTLFIMCEDALTKSQAIYGGGRISLAVKMWAVLVSQKEMRHLASQDMSLPYPFRRAVQKQICG